MRLKKVNVKGKLAFKANGGWLILLERRKKAHKNIFVEISFILSNIKNYKNNSEKFYKKSCFYILLDY